MKSVIMNALSIFNLFNNKGWRFWINYRKSSKRNTKFKWHYRSIRRSRLLMKTTITWIAIKWRIRWSEMTIFKNSNRLIQKSQFQMLLMDLIEWGVTKIRITPKNNHNKAYQFRIILKSVTYKRSESKTTNLNKSLLMANLKGITTWPWGRWAWTTAPISATLTVSSHLSANSWRMN